MLFLKTSKHEYEKTLNSLCGCLEEHDTGEDFKDIIGDEIMKRSGYLPHLFILL